MLAVNFNLLFIDTVHITFHLVSSHISMPFGLASSTTPTVAIAACDHVAQNIT